MKSKKWEPDISEEKYVQTSDSLGEAELVQQLGHHHSQSRAPILAMPAMNDHLRRHTALLSDPLQGTTQP